MALERLLLALAICLFAAGVYVLYRTLHMRSVSRLVAVRAGGPAMRVDPLKPRVVYFRSDNCGPCMAQGRFLEQVQAQFGADVEVEKIDADREPDRAAEYGIFTLPTTLVIDCTGEARHINYGLTDARKLAHQVRSVTEA